MAEKKPTDPATQALNTIGTGIKRICENQKALHADQKVLSENQKFLLERFPVEIGPLHDQLIQITERLDQIERTIHDDAWARRGEGTNG